MKLFTTEQMRELDRCAIEDYAVPAMVLMENAGRAAAEVIDCRYRSRCPGPLLVVAGRGNNGGDGFVAARHLQASGWQVHVLVLAERSMIRGEAAVNLEVLEKSRCAITFAANDAEVTQFLDGLPTLRLVVDAIFGNGLSTPLQGHYLYAVRCLNAMQLPIAAIDMPSGVDASSGQILGDAIMADCSITFAFPKLGQVSYPAQARGGELFVAKIGMPACLMNTVETPYALVDEEQARLLLPVRPADGHKGTFGHVLVIGGSTGKSGAARLCATASLRSGCGLVTLATPLTVQQQLAAALCEVMSVPLAEVDGGLALGSLDDITALWEGKAVVALGPGLGQHPQTRQLTQKIASACPLPLVLDADALNALVEVLPLLHRGTQQIVITPHPGEMSRLTGLSIETIQQDRCRIAGRFAEQWQVVVVLKGARTVIAAPDGRIWLNSSGNSGMGSAGMGDVLTGVIAAWLAQGLDPFSAAVLGVYLHGKAADRCAVVDGSAGYLATDVLRQLPAVRQALAEKE